MEECNIKNNNNPHKNHRQRIRDRFISNSDLMLEHELIELLLYYAIPRINTNDIAHELLNKFTDISGMFEASKEELAKINGVGESTALFLNLVSDICNEYENAPESSEYFTTIENIQQYFINYFIGADSGVCLAISLNNNLTLKNKISFIEKDFLNSSSEIRRTAEFFLKNDCRRIVLGINHPERRAIPDNIDFKLINIFAKKFSQFDMELIDCIICSKDKTFSLRHKSAFSFRG